MRVCPFDGCSKTISSTMFCCRPHWFALTRAEKDRINLAYTQYLENEINIDELRRIQNEVTDLVQRRV